jgi:hypothetical protein
MPAMCARWRSSTSTPGSAPTATARSSPTTSTAIPAACGCSTSVQITGDTHIGLAQSLPRAEATGITLEYGTLPLPDMLNAVRADNWLHVHGDLESRQGREIKAEIRAAFYQEKDDWKSMVFDRAVDVLGRAMKGLTQS